MTDNVHPVPDGLSSQAMEPQASPPTASIPDADCYCSFCGKSDKDAYALIAGPTVFICDECVGTCAAVIAERRMMDAMRRFFNDAENENWKIVLAKAMETGTANPEGLDATHDSAARRVCPTHGGVT